MGRIFKDAEIFCKKRPPVASGGTMGKIELFGRSSQLNGFFPGSLELHVGHIADFKLRIGHRFRHFHLHIGRNANLVHGVAIWGKILAVGKLEACFAVGERDHLLHDALAKGGGTHDGGALMILQAAGENLAGGGGAAVDQ